MATVSGSCLTFFGSLSFSVGDEPSPRKVLLSIRALVTRRARKTKAAAKGRDAVAVIAREHRVSRGG